MNDVNDGYKGACHVCESVGELNVKLQKEIKELKMKTDSRLITDYNTIYENLQMERLQYSEEIKELEDKLKIAKEIIEEQRNAINQVLIYYKTKVFPEYECNIVGVGYLLDKINEKTDKLKEKLK